MPSAAVSRRGKRLMELRDCYVRLCGSDDGQKIVADLARVCKFKSTFDENPIRLARNVGRGEVFTHVQTMAALTDRQIMSMLEIESDGEKRAQLLDAIEHEET